MLAPEQDRIRAHTQPEILAEIDQAIESRIRFYATQSRGMISMRLGELEREWDIDRWLETNVAGIALGSLLLGLRNKRWSLLTASLLAMLLEQAVHGWSPLVPLFRRAGVRTRSEIEREKFALKILRGDFEQVPPRTPQNQVARASDVLRAVSV